MAPLKHRTSRLRWVKEHVVLVLPVIGGIGLGVGMILGWVF